MPTEAGRTTSTKRITNPSDSSQFIDIPVIDSVSFVDPFDRYQETEFTFSNTIDADRTVHVDRIFYVDDLGAIDQLQYADFERIEVLKTLDALDRYQDSEVSIDNVTGGDTHPPSFTAHLKTHVKRIYGVDDNSDCWIDIERVDQITFIDPFERYQETVFTLGPWADEQE